MSNHISQSTGKPKIQFSAKDSVLKAAEKMNARTGKHFSAYKCVFCNGYHIGKNRDSKYEPQKE